MFKRREGSQIQKIIGLCGKARAGKNYLAEQVIAPLGFWPFAFAWALKNGIVGRGLASFDEVYVTKGPIVRKLMQEEGTERGRDIFGDDLWVNTALAWMELMSQEWGIRNYVITDVRFPNEKSFIQDLGGKVYYIHAPTRTDANDLTAEARQHRSETLLEELDGFDGVINNDEGIDNVEQQIREMLLRDGLWDPLSDYLKEARYGGAHTGTRR